MTSLKLSKNEDLSDDEFSNDDNLDDYHNSDIESDSNEDNKDLPEFKKDKINVEFDNDENEHGYIDDDDDDNNEETYEQDDDEEDENHTYIEDNINMNETENDIDMKHEIIVKSDNRITSNILSIYEYIELISIRASQISNGSYVFTDVAGYSDPIEMAKKELIDNRCPLYVKRGVGMNRFELWSPNVMSKPKI